MKKQSVSKGTESIYLYIISEKTSVWNLIVQSWWLIQTPHQCVNEILRKSDLDKLHKLSVNINQCEYNVFDGHIDNITKPTLYFLVSKTIA